MLTLQRQPTRTSCGPTTVAMLADVPVADVLALQPAVRLTATRRRLRCHRTNVGELARLLDAYGLRLGPRAAFTTSRLQVIRVDRAVGRGWHWAAADGTWVYDSCLDEPVFIAEYHRALGVSEVTLDGRLSVYPVVRAGEPMPRTARRQPWRLVRPSCRCEVCRAEAA
jgi:hypothetical protein